MSSFVPLTLVLLGLTAANVGAATSDRLVSHLHRSQTLTQVMPKVAVHPPALPLSPLPFGPLPQSPAVFYNPVLPVTPPVNIVTTPGHLYGGGGGTVTIPEGGSFGRPPLAGGSFGGGQPTGGSFGNGHRF